jgi:lipopolysaccharide/colanic/teichoic acid biosynthesis glycosyltransferase
MIRILDFSFALIGLLLTFPLLVVISLIILFESGNPFFMQARLGENKEMFTLIKFRTMTKGTKSVASHLADASQISKLGMFLRKTKLDELPQLFNVLMGDMSLVGARPNLENQLELIKLREQYAVYRYKPGITGLAQIQNIDMSTPELLAKTDARMFENLTVKNYFYFILKTVSGSGSGDAASK